MVFTPYSCFYHHTKFKKDSQAWGGFSYGKNSQNHKDSTQNRKNSKKLFSGFTDFPQIGNRPFTLRSLFFQMEIIYFLGKKKKGNDNHENKNLNHLQHSVRRFDAGIGSLPVSALLGRKR
jgi:hypothetical protein